MKKSEGKIQQEIVMWFNNNYCLKTHNPRCSIFSVPNEGRNVREQIYKKTLGMKTGVSDLIVLMPERCVFVEVKTEIGKQSDKQKDFQNLVENIGFEYYVIRCLEDFKKII
jgi:hypothetical protein